MSITISWKSVTTPPRYSVRDLFDALYLKNFNNNISKALESLHSPKGYKVSADHYIDTIKSITRSQETKNRANFYADQKQNPVLSKVMFFLLQTIGKMPHNAAVPLAIHLRGNAIMHKIVQQHPNEVMTLLKRLLWWAKPEDHREIFIALDRKFLSDAVSEADGKAAEFYKMIYQSLKKDDAMTLLRESPSFQTGLGNPGFVLWLDAHAPELIKAAHWTYTPNQKKPKTTKPSIIKLDSDWSSLLPQETNKQEIKSEPDSAHPPVILLYA